MSYAYVKELQPKTTAKSPTKSPATLRTTHLKYPLNSPVWRANKGIPCSECGAPVTVDANFCMECGARVLLSSHKNRSPMRHTPVLDATTQTMRQLQGQEDDAIAAAHRATSPVSPPLKGALARSPLSSEGKEGSMPRHHVTIQERPPGASATLEGDRQLYGTTCHHPPGTTSCPCCSAQWPPTRIEGHRPVHFVDPNTFSSTSSSQSQDRSPQTRSFAQTEWPASPTSPSTPFTTDPPSSMKRASIGGVSGVEDHVRTFIRTHYQTLEEAFNAFDSDGDGLIDGMEFETAIREMFGMNFLTRLEITALMSRCDTDGDGYIDVEEFMNFLKGENAAPSGTVVAQAVDRLKHYLESRYSSMRDAFKQLNKDHSGYLAKEDVRQALEATGLKVTEPELEALVAQFDTNNDGRVSHAEFMRLMVA